MIGAALLLQVAAAMPLLEQGRFSDARMPLEKACAAREANGCSLLGRTLYTLDQYEAALRVLTPLAATDRDPWRVQDALGSVYEALRRPAEAERAFVQAVSGNRDRTADPRYHLGRFLIREGRAAEAIAILTPAVEKFPRHELAHFELGRALYQTGRFAEAEIQLSRAPSLEEARRLLDKLKRQGPR